MLTHHLPLYHCKGSTLSPLTQHITQGAHHLLHFHPCLLLNLCISSISYMSSSLIPQQLVPPSTLKLFLFSVVHILCVQTHKCCFPPNGKVLTSKDCQKSSYPEHIAQQLAFSRHLIDACWLTDLNPKCQFILIQRFLVFLKINRWAITLYFMDQETESERSLVQYHSY